MCFDSLGINNSPPLTCNTINCFPGTERNLQPPTPVESRVDEAACTLSDDLVLVGTKRKIPVKGQVS